MIKHGMNVIKTITHFLNPGQIPIMGCDCPIFAKTKFIQWTWLDTHGEDKFVVMFGGMHLEMALWNVVGDYLEGSGWTTALIDAGIATAGTADSFLKVSHLARTRNGHQVTLVALVKLQKQTSLLTDGCHDEKDYDAWVCDMAKKSSTFKFWNTIIVMEKVILILIRAHRENNFNLYVEAMVGFFFAFDHYNYARLI